MGMSLMLMAVQYLSIKGGRMIKKNKWYNLSLSFQLEKDIVFKSDKEYLKLWGRIGKALGIQGLVADVKINEQLHNNVT